MEIQRKPAPSGAELLKTLIRLLSEQEGVKITYELERVSA